jgi:hypothetical protein
MIQGTFVAEYFQCSSCQFVYANNPEWIQGSFTKQLNQLDLGSVDRSLILADFMEVFCRSNNLRGAKSLDWGGGYGLLTRIMRDRGFNFFNYDPFVEDLFSGPSVGSPDEKYDCICISEVLLHLPDPRSTLKQLMGQCDYLLVTAVVPPSDISSSWWYLMPDTGQHISLFPVKTLKSIADQIGVHLTTDGRFFHLFHTPHMSFLRKTILRKRAFVFGLATWFSVKRNVLRGFGRTESLTKRDQDVLIQGLPWNVPE